MTISEAKHTFATLMQTSRKRKLSARELTQLSEARQKMRAVRRPMSNRPTRPIGKGKKTAGQSELYQEGYNDVITQHGFRRKYLDDPAYNEGWQDALKAKKSGKVYSKANPSGKPVLIYGKVKRIEAQKTQNHICDDECKKFGHRYFHEFTSSPKMYGLPDGSLLIKV